MSENACTFLFRTQKHQNIRNNRQLSSMVEDHMQIPCFDCDKDASKFSGHDGFGKNLTNNLLLSEKSDQEACTLTITVVTGIGYPCLYRERRSLPIQRATNAYHQCAQSGGDIIVVGPMWHHSQHQYREWGGSSGNSHSTCNLDMALGQVIAFPSDVFS